VIKKLVVAACAIVVSGAAPLLAQAPAQTPKTPPPAQAPKTPPPVQAPKPPAEAPKAPPAQPPAETAPPPQPPAPFPAGAKVAFVNLQAIAQLSADGKAAATKVQALTTAKSNEIAERTKALQAQQQKLQSGSGVMSDAARVALEKDIERLNRELERFQQDAQVDVNELQAELQQEFQKKLLPVLEAILTEKELHFLFSGADAGLILAAPGLDLTLEAVKRLDAATKKP
jgi:outer membrane protein